MPINIHIDNYTNSPEQRLVQDLIIESIKFYGRDFYYLPRRQSEAYDDIYGEDPKKYFSEAHVIEMYIKNVEGFEGEGDFISRFGLEIRDQTTLTVAIRRFEELLEQNQGMKAIGMTRPREGDLIYFDFVNPDPKFPGRKGLFLEIMHVEHEAMYYQLGDLYVYDLRCEAFRYSQEEFTTGIDNIDSAFANTTSSYVYTGNTMPDSIFADNTDIETEADNVLDFSDDSPFGDYGNL